MKRIYTFYNLTVNYASHLEMLILTTGGLTKSAGTGSIIISNDALIEIREQGGNLNLENGANLKYIKGTIQ